MKKKEEKEKEEAKRRSKEIMLKVKNLEDECAKAMMAKQVDVELN